MPKHIVCLTFDFDAISGWIARGMATPSPISRGEFGPDVAVPRILDLLDRYGIATTWYVPGHTLESYPEPCRRVFGAGHEIGHHGWSHRSPVGLSREEEEGELRRANECIRALTGSYARGYRSPGWDLSPHSVELLIKHEFVYDSSMMGNDYAPYRVRHGDVIELEKPAVFGSRTKLIEMPISWSLDDFPYFEFIRTPDWIMQGGMNAGAVLENWIGDFAYMRDHVDWGILTYTFHPFVIGRGHRMRVLEQLICSLRDGGAEFMRVDDAAAEYARRYPCDD